MQINRLVNFHKALGDVTRLRIIVLLKNGPLHGQALAGKLGVKPPTITHHIAKLRDVGLIYQRRDKNTIYFYLDKKKLEANVKDILTIGNEGEKMDVEQEKLKVINNFFTADGKLKQIPAQRKKKLYILEHMIKGLTPGVKYGENEINEYIKQFHEDYATIRREWIMCHFMYRENMIYELNPPELWGKS